MKLRDTKAKLEVTILNKSQKDKITSLYYMKPVKKEPINEEKEEKKRVKEREKRIKEKRKSEINAEKKFDLETETVIGMAKRNYARNKNLNKKIVSKNERKKLKKIKRIKRIVKWTLIIAIIAGGVTFAMISPIFNIQEIKVNNISRISADTIVSLSGLKTGQNIFRLFTSSVEKNIEQEPYVETAEVKRVLPNKIEINVVERQRNYSLEFLNGFAYINNQGYILEISNYSAGLPILQGTSTPDEEIKAGNRLQIEDLEKLGTVIRIMDLCKSNGLDGLVTSIDMTNKNNYSIYMEQEKKTIYLGDESNLSDKILWIKAILDDNKGVEGEIYLNGDLNNNFKPRFKQKV